MTLKDQLTYCQNQLDRCITDDNPFDASYWYREIAKIEQKIKEQETKQLEKRG